LPPKKKPIDYFYKKILKDINIKSLHNVYDKIVAETELNPNLEKVFDYLKKEQKMDKKTKKKILDELKPYIDSLRKSKKSKKKYKKELLGLVKKCQKAKKNKEPDDFYAGIL
jgi:MoxR-like ATPase